MARFKRRSIHSQLRGVYTHIFHYDTYNYSNMLLLNSVRNLQKKVWCRCCQLAMSRSHQTRKFVLQHVGSRQTAEKIRTEPVFILFHGVCVLPPSLHRQNQRLIATSIRSAKHFMNGDKRLMFPLPTRSNSPDIFPPTLERSCSIASHSQLVLPDLELN